MTGPIFSADVRAVTEARDIVIAEIMADAKDGWFDGATISDLGELNNWVDANDYIDRALTALETKYGWSKEHLAADIADEVNRMLEANPVVTD